MVDSVVWKSRIIGRGEEQPSQLVSNPLNWRVHPKEQREALEGVLDEVGWVQDVVVNKRTGHLIDGHLRVELAAKRKEASVPVLYVDLDEAEEALILASLDPISAMAETDKQKLEELMRDVNSGDARVQQMMSDLAEREHLQFGAEPPADVEPQIDKAEELREKWGVEAGQLWQLGEHRLICGDCTYPETVERLLGMEKADMILTDPPYALFGNSTGVSGITDDKMTAPFFREIFKRAKEFTKLFAHIYVCCDWHSAFALRQAGVDVGLSEKNLIVWDKGDGGVGAMYQQCYELIWFFANSPKSSALGGRITGERTVNGVPNIWRVGRESSKREHGAQKPIELFSIPVTYGADENEIVMDLFLGSGTTLIACERLGRKCRAVEISPAYCAVALQRWADVTGGTPVILD